MSVSRVSYDPAWLDGCFGGLWPCSKFSSSDNYPSFVFRFRKFVYFPLYQLWDEALPCGCCPHSWYQSPKLIPCLRSAVTYRGALEDLSHTRCGPSSTTSSLDRFLNWQAWDDALHSESPTPSICDEEPSRVPPLPTDSGYNDSSGFQNQTCDVSLDSAREILSMIKPVNLICLVRDFVNGNATDRFSILTRLAEMYNLLWVKVDNISGFLLSGLKLLCDYFPSLLSFDFWNNNDGLTINEDGFLASVRDFCVEHFGVSADAFSTLASPVVVVLGFCMLCVTGLCGVDFLKKFDFTKTILPNLKTFADTCRSFRDITKGPDSLLSSVMSCAGSLFGFTWEDAHTVARNSLVRRIKTQLDSLEKMQQDIRQSLPKLLSNPVFFTDLKRELDSLDKLYVDLASKTENMANARPMLDRAKTAYESLLATREGLMSAMSGKQVPTLLWLYGDSGIGKSESVSAIVSALSALEGRPLLTYTRCPSPYWTGYMGQDVVIYDDLCALKNDTDVSELPLIHSPNAFRVNIAECNEKKTMFCSRYIIVCSNILDIARSENLAKPEIIDRRRDLLFHATVRDDSVRANTQPGPGGRILPENILYKPGCAHLKFSLLKNDRDSPNRTMNPDFGTVQNIAQTLWGLQEAKRRDFEAKLDHALLEVGVNNQTFDPLLFSGISVSTNRVILLLGVAGCGKTTLAAGANNAKVINECFDDSSSWSSLFTMVKKVYDREFEDDSFKSLILTANRPGFDAFITSLPEQDRVAFLRRLDLFEFSFRCMRYVPTPKWATVADIKDDASYDKCVSIKYRERNSNDFRSVNIAFTRAFIRDACKPVRYTAAHFSEVPKANIVSADYILRVDSTFSDLFNATFSATQLWKKTTFLKGKFSPVLAAKLVPVFSSLDLRADTPDNVLDKLVMFNNAKIKSVSGEITVILHLTDMSVWIAPIEGFYVFGLHEPVSFKRLEDGFYAQTEDGNVRIDDDRVVSFYSELSKFISHDLASTRDAFNMAVGGSIAPFAKMYNIVNVALFLAQTGLAIGAVVTHTTFSNIGIVPVSNESEGRNEDPNHHVPRPIRARVVTQKEATVDRSLFGHGVDFSTTTSGFAWGDSPMGDESTGDLSARAVEILIHRNIVEVVTKLGEFKCSGVMLKGHLGVTVFHAGTDFAIRYKNKMYDVHCLSGSQERDYRFFQVVPQCPQFSDITSHIPSGNEIVSHQGCYASLSCMERSDCFSVRTVKLHELMSVPIDVDKVTSPNGRKGRSYVFLDSYGVTSPIGTVPGDCGSPLILHDPKVQKKFLGFHSCASKALGLSAYLVREDVDAVTLKNETVDRPIFALPHQAVVLYDTPKPCTTEDTKHFVTVGLAGVKTKSGDVQLLANKNRSTSTQLWASPFQNDFPVDGPNYAPSVLDHKDPRLATAKGFSVYENATNKWSHSQPVIDEPRLERVFNDISNFLISKLREHHVELKVLTNKEALNGVSDYDRSNPLWRKSSPGYPFTTWEEFRGKDKSAALVQGDDGLWRFAPGLGTRLESCVANLINTCRSNTVKPACVFVSSLKDELLTEDKIASGRTRAFAASPFDFTIAHRRYFHALSAACASISFDLPIKIGINPTSTEWGILYSYLTRFGDSGFDGDFKNWDASVPLSFMSKLAPLYNKIFAALDPGWKEEDDFVRSGLYSVLEGPLLLYYDEIVRCPGGQVSGQPHTSFDNCIINMAYYYYAWLNIMEESHPHWCNWHTFASKVSFAVYGDDNLCGVAPDALEYFNFVSFEKVMRSLNLDLTPADKGVSDGKVKKVSDMLFLKRKFVKLHGRWVGPLEPKVFKKMCSYTKFGTRRSAWVSCNEVKYSAATLSATISCALTEASLHGSEFFDKLKCYFVRKASTCSFELPIIDDFFTYFNRCVYGTSMKAIAGLPEIEIDSSTPVSRKEVCSRCFRNKFDCNCYCRSCGFLPKLCVCKSIPDICNNCNQRRYFCICCTFCRSLKCSCWSNAVNQTIHPKMSTTRDDFICSYISRFCKDFNVIISDSLCAHCGEPYFGPNDCCPSCVSLADQTLYGYRGFSLPFLSWQHYIDSFLQTPEPTFIDGFEEMWRDAVWENQSAPAANTAPAVPTGGDGTMAMCDQDQSVVPDATTAAPPMETAGMVSGAVAAQNVLDPWFFEHYVHLARFTWSTTTAPGTLLWSSPIAPQYAHPNLAYVSRMYNAWAGGLDYNIKIAGTGFHAGAIVVVRLPPNIPPTSVQAVGEYTYYDYCIIDPKHLDVFSKSVCDQRRMLYHYRSNESTSDIDSIGGYIAIYCLLQLNTSSSGANQIDVEILNKASLDFFPAQMRNIPSGPGVDAFTQWEKVISPEVADLHGMAVTRSPAAALVLTTLTTTTNAYGCINVEGTANLNIYPAWRPYDATGHTTNNPVLDSSTASSAIYTFPYVTESTDITTFIRNNPGLNCTANAPIPDSAGDPDSCYLDAGYTSGGNYIPGNNVANLLSFMTNADFNITQTGLTITGTVPSQRLMTRYIVTTFTGAPALTVPTPGETFVGFNPLLLGFVNPPALPQVLCLQSTLISDALFAGALPKFPQSSALMFQLVDVITETPIISLKLYYEGFFTCSAVSTSTTISLRDCKLSFVGVVNRFTKLPPASSTYLVNQQVRQLSQQLAEWKRLSAPSSAAP